MLAVRSDLLTGRAPAVPRAASTCGELRRPEPDPAPVQAMPAQPPEARLPLLRSAAALGPAHLDDAHTYLTPDDYLGNVTGARPSNVRSLMLAGGFRGATSVRYQAGPLLFGGDSYQMGSPAQAAEFEWRVLVATCELGVTGHVRSLAGVAGGVTYTYDDVGHPPFRAMFLVGDTVVRLTVCACGPGGGDPFELLGRWARELDATMRAGSPV